MDMSYCPMPTVGMPAPMVMPVMAEAPVVLPTPDVSAPPVRHARPKQLREGDWECDQCNNINFSKRTRCNKCSAAKPKSNDDVPHWGGPPGLFKQGDWACPSCGNVNWARRDTCNICNGAKPGLHENEPRTGKGGGHYDRQDPADRNTHDSDEEEIDDFGRKKKKARKIMHGGRHSDNRREGGGSLVMGQGQGVVIADKFPFPPAPPPRKKRKRISGGSRWRQDGKEDWRPKEMQELMAVNNLTA
eukprot:Platyproteum_vivax@DN2255_c0_g1_i1.p1